MERLRDLRERVETGRYQVPPRDVAEAMMARLHGYDSHLVEGWQSLQHGDLD